MTRLVDRCGLCRSKNLDTVLSLGTSPATCSMRSVGQAFASEEHHPLDLLRCADCSLVQLSVVVDPEEVFPQNYPYQSGNSGALHKNFEDLAAQVGPLEPHDLVVDIGANDGTLLSKFDGRKVGVEPTRQVARIVADGTYGQFFTEALAHKIVATHGRAKVVTACNVLAHVEDINDVMRGIDVLLAPDGTLVAENHDLASVVDGGQWDTVYHEHLRFFDPYSFNKVLRAHGFATYRYDAIETHGGSFRTVAKKGHQLRWPPPKREYDFDGLALQAAAARRELRRVSGMAGIGATARATTIINYCGMDVEDIPYVCEVPGSDKIGRYIPGTRIPVVDEARLFEDHRPAVLFSWHMADLIVPKLRERGYQGDIWVPLPAVHPADGLAVAA